MPAFRYRRCWGLLRAAAAAVAILFAFGAGAQQPDWPARAISIVVPFPPGGATDLVARILAQGLSPRLGQQVLVENRPGATGAVGTAYVARARPDGYTLVMGGVNTHAMIEAVHRNLPYATLRDFAPVALTANIPIAIVSNPSISAATLADLIALARAQPGGLSYGSAGTGSPHHLAMELLKQVVGIDPPSSYGRRESTCCLSGP